MNYYKEFAEYWGSMMVPISREALSNISFHPDTVSFLTNFGLPNDKRLNDYLKLGIEFDPEGIYTIVYEGSSWLVIGTIQMTHEYLAISEPLICLKEYTGEVYIIETEADQSIEPQFVNNSLEKLLVFLKICLENKPKMKSLGYQIDSFLHDKTVFEETTFSSENPRKALDILVEDIRKEFLSIDSIALAKSENYWSTILFDWSI